MIAKENVHDGNHRLPNAPREVSDGRARREAADEVLHRRVA
jgi:hypothetical protein